MKNSLSAKIEFNLKHNLPHLMRLNSKTLSGAIRCRYRFVCLTNSIMIPQPAYFLLPTISHFTQQQLNHLEIASVSMGDGFYLRIYGELYTQNNEEGFCFEPPGKTGNRHSARLSLSAIFSLSSPCHCHHHHGTTKDVKSHWDEIWISSCMGSSDNWKHVYSKVICFLFLLMDLTCNFILSMHL